MKIEKNIPIPRRKTYSKYDFIKYMEVGDSVLVESRDAAVALIHAMKFRKFTGCMRKCEEGIRVWRTS